MTKAEQRIYCVRLLRKRFKTGKFHSRELHKWRMALKDVPGIEYIVWRMWKTVESMLRSGEMIRVVPGGNWCVYKLVRIR